MRTDPFIDREMQRTKADILRASKAVAQGKVDALARQPKRERISRPNQALDSANAALDIARTDQMFQGQYRKDVLKSTGMDVKRMSATDDASMKALQRAGRIGVPDAFAAKSRQFEQNILMSEAQKGGAFGPSYGSSSAGQGNVKAKARNAAKSAERTDQRMALDAMQDAEALPFRTRADDEMAAEESGASGTMTDRYGTVFEDTGRTINRGQPAPAASPQPTIATTFRQMGSSRDPLDMGENFPTRFAMDAGVRSALDDLLPMIEAGKAKRAPIEAVATTAKSGRDQRMSDVRRKRLQAILDGNPGMDYDEARRLAFNL